MKCTYSLQIDTTVAFCCRLNTKQKKKIKTMINY